MRKKKDALDKLFVNCNKLKEDEAKRILSSRKDLSLRSFKWDIPLDLRNIGKELKNNFRTETIIGLGRWNNQNVSKKNKFICIEQNGELIYLEPEIVKIMYNSIK